jgi:GT2 family glycosyltransferase
MASLTVIIPNFNGLNHLKECLKSLKEQNMNFGVVVVDNGSSDGGAKYVENNYPEYDLIINSENLGFSRAVNQGIKSVNTDYIVLLNNDVVLGKNCIKNLLKCAQKHDDVFAVGSKMLQSNNEHLIDDAGDEYTLLGFTRKVGNNKSTDLYNSEREIFSACAGAALYRRDIFEEIGYFDENFFAYMEDVDISYRSRIYGYKCVYCPDALVYHVGSATSGSKYNAFKIRLAARNNVYVPYKNMPWPLLLLNIIFLFMGYSIKYLFFLRKGYGNDYLKGLNEGLNSLNKVSKVKFRRDFLLNHLSIEWYLIKNTVRIIW